MNSTNNQPTSFEKKYAKQQFKVFYKVINWLWIIFLVIVLLGILFTFSDFPLLGIPFIFIGIFGAVFYKKNSTETKINLQGVTYKHTGILNSKTIKVLRGYRTVYYLDHYTLVVPGALEDYLSHLEDKYYSIPVTMTFVALKITKQDKTEELYTPIVIENDLCINKTIEKYGTNFLIKDKLYLYGQIAVYMGFLLLFFFAIVIITDVVDLAENAFILGANVISSMYFSLYFTKKIFDSKKMTDDQKNRFKC